MDDKLSTTSSSSRSSMGSWFRKRTPVPSSASSQISVPASTLSVSTLSTFSTPPPSQHSRTNSIPSFHPRDTAKKVFEVLTGISDHVGERRAQLDELGSRCTRLGSTLETGRLYWSNENLKQCGLAAQGTLDRVLSESTNWETRWYAKQLANDVTMKEDIDRWSREVLLAIEECTMTLLHEIALGKQSLRLVDEDPNIRGNMSMLTQQDAESVRAGYQLLLDKAIQELNSSDTELLPEQRATLFKELRHILTTMNIPDSVRLQGTLTLDYGTHLVNVGSDVFRGAWITEIEGQQRSKIVAIKRLRDPNPRKERVKKFMYEGTLWRLLAHDNIVPFYGIHEQKDGGIELVSMWAENGDAMRYIREHPSCNRRAIIKGAAHGLAYLHRCDVVHGAIVGANILLDNNCRPMLSDFGLAAASSADGEIISAGMSNSQTTTAARWMAPEMTNFTSPAPVLASDVFSFGRTMLEILTGEKPFPKQKNIFTLIAMLSSGMLQVERPEGEEVRKRGLTDDVWALMNEMWKHNREQRPTIDEVARRLERLM